MKKKVLVEKKNSKITFSEKVDGKLSGLALGFSFILAGVILIIFPNYFGNDSVTLWVRIAFIVVGVLGLIVEMKKESKIKGYDDLSTGIFLMFIWLILFLAVNNVLLNIIAFLFFVVGAYATFLGFLKTMYSFWLLGQQKPKGWTSTATSEIIAFLTKIASLILIVMQILKIFIQ